MSNEELQSTNEELEATKEELQATNEELSTVNDELGNGNLQLTRLSDDLSNVLTSAYLSKPEKESHMYKLKLLAMLAIAAALVMGCTAAVAPAKGGTVNATLTEMKIVVDRNSISAGPVTFVVKNSGAVVHELVVLQTDVPQDKLAADPAQAGKVVETGNIGETGDVIAGASKTFTVTLPAGHYVLMCNQVGHYTSGMHMAFTVN